MCHTGFVALKGTSSSTRYARFCKPCSSLSSQWCIGTSETESSWTLTVADLTISPVAGATTLLGTELSRRGSGSSPHLVEARNMVSWESVYNPTSEFVGELCAQTNVTNPTFGVIFSRVMPDWQYVRNVQNDMYYGADVMGQVGGAVFLVVYAAFALKYVHFHLSRDMHLQQDEESDDEDEDDADKRHRPLHLSRKAPSPDHATATIAFAATPPAQAEVKEAAPAPRAIGVTPALSAPIAMDMSITPKAEPAPVGVMSGSASVEPQMSAAPAKDKQKMTQSFDLDVEDGPRRWVIKDDGEDEAATRWIIKDDN